jgi:putative peptidoglycan lipid II flippase
MTGLRASIVVAAGRAASMILTFAFGVLSARTFGASPDKDCYLVAKALPTVVTNVLVGGVVPLLLVALARLPAADRPRLAGVILRGATRRLALLLVPILAAGWVLAPRLVAAMAPGFASGSIDLTAHLFRIALLAIVGSLGVACLRSLFNAGGEFTLPAIADVTTGVIALGVLAWGASRIGIPSLAYAGLLGPVVAVSLLTAVALASGRLRWRSDAGGAPPDPQEEAIVWRRFLVMCLGSNFGSINVLVDNYFASHLPAGSISSLGFASVLITGAQGLFIFSVAEIAFARLARAAGDEARFREDAGRMLRSLVLLSLPLVAGSLALARPIVRTLYERGAFDPATTEVVTRLLRILAPELLIMAFLALFWRVLVARGSYGVVGVVSTVSIASNILLDAVLGRALGVGGIALATPLVTLVTTLAFWPSIRRSCGRLWGGGDHAAAIKGALAAAAMGLLVAGWSAWFETAFGIATMPLRVLQVTGGVALGAVLYTVLLAALGIRDVTDVIRRLVVSLRPA